MHTASVCLFSHSASLGRKSLQIPHTIWSSSSFVSFTRGSKITEAEGLTFLWPAVLLKISSHRHRDRQTFCPCLCLMLCRCIYFYALRILIRKYAKETEWLNKYGNLLRAILKHRVSICYLRINKHRKLWNSVYRFMGVKLGLWHEGKDMVRGCWGRYLAIRVTKWRKTGENCITRSFMIALLSKQYYVDQIKDSEMLGACSTYGKHERFIKGFGREIRSGEKIWNTFAYIGR